jgi:carbonic anhydrase/acetyltransferase-like protein (isoleucine patch superfamily)
MPLYRLGDDAPQLPASSRFWVAPDAQIIGRVSLGEDVGVWFGAALRGDNEWITIGAGSNIQEGVVLHTDMGFPLSIGENCTIGHRAVLHGCTLGHTTLIGMGAMVMNGAKIGNQCLVGANALITEGKEFPDRSLIMGSPARLIRLLDNAAVMRLQISAQNYVKNWQNFQKNLHKLEDKPQGE